MELIIRSQDKTTLIKFTNITIEEYMDNHVIIRNYQEDGSSFKLGEYKSLERGLLVLEDIYHTLLSDKTYNRYLSYTTYSTITDTMIYDMPEDR